MRDVEATGEDEESYDVMVARHLVWTLVDAPAAFAHWFSLLKPGGKVLIIDGDFVTPTLLRRVRHTIITLIASFRSNQPDPRHKFSEEYKSIMSQIYFRDGARATEVAALLRAAGFENVTVDRGLWDIQREQSRNMSLGKFLDRIAIHRYAISATKPLDGGVSIRR